MNLTSLFEQILLISIMGSILAIAILLIKTIFRKKLSAKIHYYIWFLLILKLIIPLDFQNLLNPFNYFNTESQKYDISSIVLHNISSGEDLKVNTNKTLATTAVNDNYKTPTVVNNKLGFNFKTMALIWMIGALSVLTYIIFINIMLSISIKKSPHCKMQDINEILEESKLRLKISSKIDVIYGHYLKSPAVYGIIKPKILISESIINKLSTEELKFVFLHEVTHIKRKDLIVNVVIMILQVIYWFNPIIWYSLYQFKQDCEAACDATALTVLSSREVREYGQTILNMIKIVSKTNLAIGTLGFSNKYSKRRIIMISLFHKKSVICTITALCLVLAVGCSSTPNPLSTNINSNKGDNEPKVATIAKPQPEATSSNSASTSVEPKVSQSEDKSDKTNTLNSEIVTNDTVTQESKKQEYKTKLDNIEIGLAYLKEKEAGTTKDMREASAERYKKWDAALNEIYSELKKQLSSSDMKNLQSKQIQWISDRDAKAKEDSLKYKGGTMEPLVYSISLVEITKDRCYELVEKYMH
ncbi:M56 family metallopeptidase [Clostridium sp.]